MLRSKRDDTHAVGQDERIVHGHDSLSIGLHGSPQPGVDFVAIPDWKRLQWIPNIAAAGSISFSCRRWPSAWAFQITATRVKSGEISLISASRLVLCSVATSVRPVTLPPGRAKLQRSPNQGVADRRHHDRNRVGGIAGGFNGIRCVCDDHIDIGVNKFGGKRRQTVKPAIGISNLEGEVALV